MKDLRVHKIVEIQLKFAHFLKTEAKTIPKPVERF